MKVFCDYSILPGRTPQLMPYQLFLKIDNRGMSQCYDHEPTLKDVVEFINQWDKQLEEAAA